MARFYYEDRRYYESMRRRKHYSGFHFIWDLFLVFLTGGLWLIWIFVREMRGR